MSEKNINFNDSKTRKSQFYKNAKIYNIEEMDTNEILISKKKAYGKKQLFKDFIGYNDNDVIRSLFVKLPQMTGYTRNFNKNKTMSFKLNNKQLLKNYNKIQKKN